MRDSDGCWLYILRCSDGSFYTGTTRGSVEMRVSQHDRGDFRMAYTFTRRPVTLVFCEHFPNITDGIAVERQIKGWSRRKKMALIDRQWESLSELARRRS